MTENDIIGGCRTVEFAITITIACWLASLPRTFSLVSKLGTISALFTFVGYIVAVAFAAKQSSPAGYDPIGKGEPVLLIQLPASTTFSQGLTAVLTISATMFGQIAVPCFVAEMREPRYGFFLPVSGRLIVSIPLTDIAIREFPKSLLVSAVAELVVFSVVGATIYAFTGQQYVTSPAFGALQSVYKKISFTFMVPSILFVGALYASFTARFIFFRIFRDSKHTTGHTLVGWLSWSSILLVSWISAFLVAEVIPFFSALLSLSSALFTSWCGLIFWGVACLRMRGIDRKVGRCNAPIYDFFLVTANSGLILAGIFCLTAGTYASIDVIEEAFRDGQVQGRMGLPDAAVRPGRRASRSSQHQTADAASPRKKSSHAVLSQLFISNTYRINNLHQTRAKNMSETGSADSGYNEQPLDDQFSLRSVDLEYEWCYGRRYHSSGHTSILTTKKSKNARTWSMRVIFSYMDLSSYHP
ncbi:hypothetical protein HIM_12558 [Hirsutella minnesotensis 3608]|uniref:Amino acid transporter transmembrane domain-containing protein n=1 Tax=Hirsutella minnesotensis 3608 TaxID=1043627 RepID=A0A0F7ZEV5_9HYPO|nr:hypothetical protein HIM_12558 [Hirsutella minnesotensis 3608]